MGYDVSLLVQGSTPEYQASVYDSNMTSNVAPMWRKAGVDLQDLEGMLAGAAIYLLNKAIRNMQAKPEIYKAMNPKNGWGDYDGCLEFLISIQKACATFPLAQVRVSY